MSIKYMDRVWATRELKGGQLLLMLALADHANDDGECWPSQRHLGEKARLTERQVRRVTEQLIKGGFLVIAERGVGRGKKTMYQLFPQKEDKMSATKGDILSGGKADIYDSKKRTKCPEKSGHLRQQKADILDAKADISSQDYSHARSESPIEPIAEPPIQQEDEEETHVADAVFDAWLTHYGAEMPEKLWQSINNLLLECGADAVIHGIAASVAANSRNFKYIAKCARNYIPPTQNSGGRYQLEPNDTHESQPARPLPVAPPPPPPPSVGDDIWTVALREMSATLAGPARSYLAGSKLEDAGQVDGVPLYRVVVEERAAVALSWLTTQAGQVIRRKLKTLMRKDVLVEIVADGAAELEPVR